MGAKHACDICRTSRRPVGLATQDRDGWAVTRWYQEAPVVSGLATKGEAMKVLWALKHRWRSVTVEFRNGRTVSIALGVSP